MIKANGTYGAKIGGKHVFTREGAINLYKAFFEDFYNNKSYESAAALSRAAADMIAIGFTFKELEAVELETISQTEAGPFPAP